MSKSPKFSPEARERAVRMVLEHRGEHRSLWAAAQSIAGKIGCGRHDDVLDALQRRIHRNRNAMKFRRRAVEHVCGTLNDWAGSTHILSKALKHMRTEVSLPCWHASPV